jgi:outer membrane protein OmpA-like peptidoglycan-associated protein
MAQLNVEPKKNSNWWIWLIVALIALVLIFFLMRRGNDNKSAMNADTTSSTIDPLTDDWSSIDRNAPAAAYAEITDKDINVRGNDQYAIYSVDETILFGTDQTTVRPEAAEKLKQIAGSAEQRFAGGQLRIYGYTDSTGTASHNKELAEQRAQSVQNWLVQNGDVAQDRISINLVGEGQPVASNATAEGRAQNRRVEIVVRKP